MLKNYITIALRHLAKHKLFSIINILCIAIGITFSLLIGVYILNQKSINHGLRNIDRQYVIKSTWKAKGMGMVETTMGPLAQSLKDQFPNLVANCFRFNPVTNVVSAGDKNFKEDMAICDTSLVSMYGFPLVAGDKHNAFGNSSGAVITEAMAIKLFGTTNALNKTITISTIGNGKQDYLVSAVLKEMPYNSVNRYLDADGYNVFLPFEGSHYYPGTDGAGDKNWNLIFMVNMIELQPGVSIAEVKRATNQLLAQNLPNNLKGMLTPEFAPLKDYYLQNNNGAVQKMINTLSLVALFILLMAIINFVNISIGTASYRLKEIGLRKVFGSARRQLIVQHLTESLLLTTIAGLLSLGLYEVVRPYFNQVLNTTITPITELGYETWLMLLSLIIVVGCISGFYPAFVLSSTNIIHSVKGKINAAKGGLTLRRTLLIVQFSLAIIIFISALNVSRQVTYFFNKDIGYNKDQLLVLSTFPKQWDSAGIMRMQAIRNEMESVPGVQSASLSFEVPDRMPPGGIDLLPEGSDHRTVVSSTVADENFARTFGLHISQGNFFDNYRNGTARNEIILNKTAAKLLGVTAVNTIIRTPGGQTLTVTGIVNDFNYSSFQQSIGPMAFIHIKDSPQYRYMTFKIAGDNMENTVSALKAKWRSLLPNAPFEYNFMDERFKALYQSEVQLKKATHLATILNLVIVFMGIFGVMAFTLARRNKEIAVRKVLGAESLNIVLLFFKDYAILILIANIIAWPLAYWATNQWLQNYAYRMQQNIMPYASVFVTVAVATFLFVAILCLKATQANPVKNLRTE
ncbi:ABC transporter permease [Niastella sp. OAS944]|uniref:ABC transporter permease n=1 Tax=Niastella sp. OAS944 TaxID=2664089 RepID=UPI00349866D6|nr:ABC-type antimicrobial peptide transport system permease subunit [Chitinophagaceae bacterium OAS944]